VIQVLQLESHTPHSPLSKVLPDGQVAQVVKSTTQLPHELLHTPQTPSMRVLPVSHSVQVAAEPEHSLQLELQGIHVKLL
jgi:hypothetical protein